MGGKCHPIDDRRCQRQRPAALEQQIGETLGHPGRDARVAAAGRRVIASSLGIKRIVRSGGYLSGDVFRHAFECHCSIAHAQRSSASARCIACSRGSLQRTEAAEQCGQPVHDTPTPRAADLLARHSAMRLLAQSQGQRWNGWNLRPSPQSRGAPQQPIPYPSRRADGLRMLGRPGCCSA
jgi:hypothetical protein